jgi:polysaccharide export outer membrane protein
MKIHIFLISIFAIAMTASCASRKDIVYFQDEQLEKGLESTTPEQIIYKPDDILTINVSAFDQATVTPFNLTVATSNMNNATGIQGSLQLQTYLVDYNGNIEFPVLGTIKIAGLTRIELTKLLTKRISEYANDPIVSVRLENFTVTILGEVSNPGMFTIQDERITILEALGLANDLTIFGKRNNVRLIREVDGKKKFAEFDLTSINTVNSPVYYLQQNDIIYVEPNNSRIRASSYNPNSGLIISAIGTLSAIAAIILANTK